jgi:high affinity Mn2+ porin
MAFRILYPALLSAVLLPVATGPAVADDAAPVWSLHGQAVFVDQYHPAFRSPYRGPNSLDPGSQGRETLSATLYAGAKPWDGGEVWANPEIDQGFGLSNTLGLAGFSSGEGYKVGSATPYVRLQRLFFRQTFDLGGESEMVADGANQMGGTRTADRLVLTGGKISVADIFDTNTYAHDPARDFLNWAVIDAGAYDYAADAWGYSYGAAAEWSQDWWTLRAGVFALSRVPNATALQTDFRQFELVAEVEARQDWWGRAGKIKLLGFINRGDMGSYRDAVRQGLAVGQTPDTALVRRYATLPGGSINLEQEVSRTLGLFARASFNDGSKEAYEFTEINRSLSVGLSLSGAAWGLPDDSVGVAGVVNALSSSARAYFTAGGIGILIGDGRLPDYTTEKIVETYYSAQIAQSLAVTADYQFIANPAYAGGRGPVSILGARLAAQF